MYYALRFQDLGFEFDAQVGQFKHLLGVKQTPRKELKSTTVKTHPRSLKLPKKFDARTAWSQCSTIGRILGYLLASPWFFWLTDSYGRNYWLLFLFDERLEWWNNLLIKDQVCIYFSYSNGFSYIKGSKNS